MKKTAIVTGASGDIGKEIARFLLEKDFTVVGIYFNNNETLDELSDIYGDNLQTLKCDLSSYSCGKEIADYITQNNLNVNLLINNAGISIIGLLQDLDESSWNKIWNTNVTSALSVSQALIPLFLKQGYGQIINISSVWGNCGASCEVAYSTTKGAINTFTKALAKELAPSNIQVNGIACGIIDTKMNSHLDSEDIASIIEEIPVGRLGTPEDVAKTVYSISEAGSYLTGQIITLDGGWTS